MDRITLESWQVIKSLSEKERSGWQDRVSYCHELLHDGTGLGHEYLGWLTHPNNYDREEFEKIKLVAGQIRRECEAFVLIGVGGSYLGARAAIEMLGASRPKVYYAGHNLSSTYLNNLLEELKDKDIALNVVSKSGTTLEPALAFRVFREYLERKHGKEGARQRIYVTTDKNKGALKSLANLEGYQTFTVPEDIGGRFSVLTAVGLLPMAVAGLDLDQVLAGAQGATQDLLEVDWTKNFAYQYAVLRNIFYARGKVIEVLSSFEPSLFYFGEWFKQLFGESEGKDGKGIFPVTLNYTTDLHSMGQYLQDGRRHLFETILNIERVEDQLHIPKTTDNLDGLNYLSGQTLDFVNRMALQGSIDAHMQGGVPTLLLNIPERTPYYFGYLVYFFAKACALSGYLLGVNPFNQPGVEMYKKNMFRLLGRL